MAILSLSGVMLKLKFANAKGGIFQFIPPKADLRPVKRHRICDPSNDAGSAILGIERANGGASPTIQIL